jgi:pyocin large subunit-like protein
MGAMILRQLSGGRGSLPWRRLITAALAALAIFLYWTHVTERGQRLERRDVAAAEARDNTVQARANIGFVDQRRLDEHYAKHGGEFGTITKQDYLRQAQLLRDAAVGGPVLQTVRADGVTTRFDRQTGAFIAVNPNGTIRTFFKPNDGERYYRRQAERGAE